MDYNKLAELLLPDSKMTREEVFAKFPKRNLKEGAQVTRIAPSPTGFIHLGNLYSAVADERIVLILSDRCVLIEELKILT